MTNLTPQIEPTTLAPLIAPIPAPSVAFDGPLDLGTIGITAAGPETPEATGTLAITVSNLDQACGTWSLMLDAEPLEGRGVTSISAANLSLDSVNGAEFPDGGCDLDGGCTVAMVPAGPDVHAAQTFTLGVSLRLPEQVSATTFNSALTATLTAGNS